jgi:uroporphyrinogen-III decarboxylase
MKLMTITPKEITLTAIKANAERIPFNPFCMHIAPALMNMDYCHTYCQDATALVEAQIKCSDLFGIDHVHVSTDAYREASAWGVEINWSGNTPDGQKFLTIEEFNARESPDLNTAARVQNRVQGVNQLVKRVGNRQCVIGWIEAPFAELCCIFGIKNVFLMARAPDWNKKIQQLMRRIVPIQEEFAHMQIEAGADMIGAGDSIISQIGPRWYETCTVEVTHQLFQKIRSKVPVLYHICGDNNIIDAAGRDMLKLIGSTGADVFDFDFQVDLKTAKMKTGACIRGNTNTRILGNSSYSVEDVISAVHDTIIQGKPGGKYMYAAGCEWPWMPLDMAIRNLGIARALCETIGRY